MLFYLERIRRCNCAHTRKLFASRMHSNKLSLDYKNKFNSMYSFDNMRAMTIANIKSIHFSDSSIDDK